MNNLPDDLRALEANLSELVPASLLDTDRLIFEAGYAAAIAKRQASVTPGHRLVTILGSALAGVAATLLVVSLRPETVPAPPNDTITTNAPLQTGTPSISPESQPSRVAENRPRESVRPPRVRLDADAFAESTNLPFRTLRWRERLLQSGGDELRSLNVQPIVFPGSSRISETQRNQPTNLQWQRELIRDVPSTMRANT